MAESVVFDWDTAEFDALLANCGKDDTAQIALQFLPRDGVILEAGCGPGHVVRYLMDHEFRVEGIELNKTVVDKVLEIHPDLPIRVGDVSEISVPDEYYSGLVSFGVIEHFPLGLEVPLKEHFRILRPGGVAIFSVPSFNLVRRIKNAYFSARDLFNPRLNPLVRRVAGKKRLQRNARGSGGFRYHVNPRIGDFFEYWLTASEFEKEILRAGFEIEKSVPTHHFVGIWYDFGNWWVVNENRAFAPKLPGRLLDKFLKRMPFAHNHMHTIVAVRPTAHVDRTDSASKPASVQVGP